MITGLYYFLQSFQYLVHPAYRKYIFISAAISIILFLGVFLALDVLSEVWASHLTTWIPWSWSKESIVYTWILRILGFLLLLSIFKYLVLICISPFMSLLSEKLENDLSGRKRSLTSGGMLRGGLRSVQINISNLVQEWLWTIVLLAFSFIPGFALVTAPALFLVQGYYVGFGLMDFYLERYAGVRMSRTIVSSYRWFSVTLGTLFVLLFSIPIIGMLIAPTLGVVAATLFLKEKESEWLDLGVYEARN